MEQAKKDLRDAYDGSPQPAYKHSSYFDAYPEVLAKYRNRPITLVEVGLFKGGSLFMWRDFLGPEARIIGVDIDSDVLKWKEFGFEIYVGDQSDLQFWNNFFSQVGNVDVVIDDGGHTNEQQIKTVLHTLEWINDDGVLVIEDTHCSYGRDFGNPHRYSFINFAFKVVDSINNKFFGNSERLKLSNILFSVQFFQSITVFHVDRRKSQGSNPTKNIAAGRLLGNETPLPINSNLSKKIFQKISARVYIFPREYLKNFRMWKYFRS